MAKEEKLKLNAEELKEIHQDEFDIIEKERLLIEEILKDLDKDPDAITFLQKKTLLERELEITEKLQCVLNKLLESD